MRGRFDRVRRGVWGVLLGAALVASGCVGATPEEEAPGPQVRSLLQVSGVTIEHRLWEGAPAGCEGRVDHRDVTLAFAEGAPTLGVVLFDGEIVCVDAWSAIQTELAKLMGDPSPDPMLPKPFEQPR